MAEKEAATVPDSAIQAEAAEEGGNEEAEEEPAEPAPVPRRDIQPPSVDMMTMFEAAMPAILAWNMFKVIQNNQHVVSQEMRDDRKERLNKFRERRAHRQDEEEDEEGYEVEEPTDTRGKIKKRIDQLLTEQQALTEMHQRAAEAAKQRETELKEKIQLLESQVERDRIVMESIRRAFTKDKDEGKANDPGGSKK